MGLGKLSFERRPPRRARCVPFQILDDVSHGLKSDIASGGRRYSDRRPEEEGQVWTGGADMIPLILILHFLDPALTMVIK